MEWLFKSEAMVKSTLAFRKFPTLRDHPRHTGDIWMKGKRIDDDIGDFWRVHDDLYDFTEFIRIHPGGQDWLNLTKGTDITEAFEAHHISTYPETLLQKYFVKKATTPRNSPFTFHEDGFYKTLKRRVRELLKNVPETPAKTSDLYADCMLAAYLFFAIMAAKTGSYFLAAIAGITLCMLTIIAHNYFHRKDNFRMYYFDFSLMSSRSWRITHALSHHIYTNTVYDYEISFVEPFFQFLPMEKPLLVRYGSWLYGPVVYALTFVASYIRMLLQVNEDGWHTFRRESLLPFTVPIIMYLTSNATIIEVAILFLIIAIVAGAHFSIVGINAAHHHPKIFHDGDKPRSETLDWGLHELDTVADRKDINGSHFLVLTNFGDHSLHHLFPTLDHGRLKYLYPLVMEVCKEFDAEIRERTQLKLMQGQYLQLARVKPTESYAERSSKKFKRNQKG